MFEFDNVESGCVFKNTVSEQLLQNTIPFGLDVVGTLQYAESTLLHCDAAVNLFVFVLEERCIR